jgi:hypothetical protein
LAARNYVLKRLNLLRDPEKEDPRQQHIIALNRDEPACTMLLEAVDVAAVKAIPKGARTA